MVTVSQLRDLDIGRISAACERWGAFSREFYSGAASFKEGVQGGISRSGWTGHAAATAGIEMAPMLDRFRNIGSGARNVYAALFLAHSRLKTAQDQLKTQLANADKWQLSVADNGSVTVPGATGGDFSSRFYQAELFEETPGLEAAFTSVSDGIRRALQAAEDADRDLNTALGHLTPEKAWGTPKVDPGKAVSPVLQRIKDLAKNLKADGNYHLLPSNSDDERRKYISENREVLLKVARELGLPPEVVAGIAWQEVEGDPSWTDDAVPLVRRHVPFTGDQDLTSLGPMSIQIRRAAEVLGYDPENLTDDQRSEISSALKDPVQNIYIASEYLAQLKSESGFADVPPEQMTREQMQELAARYNGGPYWESEEAQAYGRGFDKKLDEATEALGR